MKTKDIFIETGCQQDCEYENLYTHEALPFDLFEDKGNLGISINLHYRLDRHLIPFTRKNIENLIKAFNPKKDGFKRGSN